MIKNSIVLLLVGFTLNSCISKQLSPQLSQCDFIVKNGYQNISESEIILVIDKDSLMLNEVKYDCTFTAFYTQKAMFDNYGKWNEKLFSGNKQHPILMWKNVSFFEDDDRKFNVIAGGNEGPNTISCSIMVFDSKNDYLSNSSTYKSKLIKHFSDLIKSNKFRSDKFYETYWKEVDPERWETILKERRTYRLYQNNF